MHKRFLNFTVALLLCVSSSTALALNDTSLKWNTITTPHFEVHYHDGAEWTAQQVARVAEEINGPITELYQYEPKYPVHFIIKDTQDYANGAAYFYENRVELWATNLEFGFRGTTDWVRNVVTHEYTHIVSIQAGRRMPQRIPAVYFQLIGFEEEKRSDVLQGYPKNIVSFPFSGVMMPPWFAEGVAQYQSPDVAYDCWDTHRDMILRSAVLEDKMLTYDQMGFFGKNGLGAEQVYDHGYGLVTYIAGRYGAEAIANATHELKTIYHLNMDGALSAATGKNGDGLYNEWKAYLKERYDRQVAPIKPNERIGSAIASKGYMTIGPTLAPDGETVAYRSNAGHDYSTTSLYTIKLERSTEKKTREEAKFIAGGASSTPQFSPDGTKILFSRKGPVNLYGADINDLYVYDIKKDDDKRLTKSARMSDADYSPDGKRIIAVHNSDGTHKLMVMDADGKNPVVLFERHSATQMYNPHFSPNGRRILFGIFEGSTREIATVDSTGGDFQYVLKSPNDERDARWISDDRIIFSSDRTGIFNIYEMDLESGWVEQKSNVIGGAFQPDISRNGRVIVYTGYSADGYSVLQLDGAAQPVQTLDRVTFAQRAAGEFDECEDLRATAMARESGGATLALAPPEKAGAAPTKADATTPAALSSDAVASVDATTPAPTSSDAAPLDLKSTKYKSAYTPFQFFPRIVIWDGTFRLGLAVSSFEILDKQSMFFGGSYGTDGEFDGFVSYEIRNFVPTLFVDGLYVRERTSDSSVDIDPTSPSLDHRFDFDLRYDLWLADIGLKFQVGDPFSLTHRSELSLYWSHAEYSINIAGNEYDENDQYVTYFSGGWKYFVGNEANLKWSFRNIRGSVDANINPRGGRDVSFWYMRAFDDLFENGEFEYGFRPAYTANDFDQFTLDWREYVSLPWWRHSLRLRAYGAVIDKDVDSFFWVYMGGRDGIRGYNYYSIGGRKGVVGSITYRFPILRNIDRQLFSFYLRDVYGSVFYEAANAWDGLPPAPGDNGGFKDSAGWELRMSLGAYYVFPTAVSIVGAYAFDPTFFVDPGFAVPTVIKQPRGWTYYLTVGFAFEL